MASFYQVHRLSLLFIIYINCISPLNSEQTLLNVNKLKNQQKGFLKDNSPNEVPPDKSPNLIPNFKSSINDQVPPSSRTNINLLAEDPNCKEDVRRICADRLKNNNFVILDCLHNEERDYPVSEACQHVIWSYKRNLTVDSRFTDATTHVCRSEIDRFPECKNVPGHLISCLMDEKENMTDGQCKQYLNKMGTIIFSDYQLVYKFTDDCKDDIDKHKCGRLPNTEDYHSQGATINCLSSLADTLSENCKMQILRIAELQSDDFHLDRSLYYACRDDRERFCEPVVSGEGRVYRCLMKHKMDRGMSDLCREKLITRQKLINQDYKVSHGLAQACRDDIKAYKCRSRAPLNTREVKLSYILLCLEDAMHRGQPVKGECQAEMLDHRRSLMEDYRINPNIVLFCDNEIKNGCNGLEKEGRTIHCLMKLAKDSWRNEKSPKIGSECYREIQALLKETDPGGDMTIDSVLLTACQTVVDAACHNVKPGDANIIPCLMDKLDTDLMNNECEDSLLEIQFFISRDFRLDARLYRVCHEDASRYCNAPSNWIDVPDRATTDLGPLVFPCLYKLAYHPVKDKKISPNCRDGVKRVMRQRANSVDLMPEIEGPCLKDLAKYCSKNVEKGEELDCLQQNFNQLGEHCSNVLKNFTEEEAEHIELNHILMRACKPTIQKFCEEYLETSIDNGDLMECLISNKNNQKMNRKCAAGIEHFQLISLKDYRFNFKFKEACKEDVIKSCTKIKTKSDVVECLSKIARDDVLTDRKHKISKECRRQLKVELLQRNENIKLDENLSKDCKKDVEKLCSDISPENAQVFECLKSNRKKLSPTCHKTLFNREKEVMEDIGTDYTLMTACKKMIDKFCSERNSREILKCLKEKKSDLDKSCKDVVFKRQVEQSLDYRLNPQLAKACKLDIPKFCKHIENDVEMEGKVISCLKEYFKAHKLSSDCEVQISSVMREAALNYHLNPVLAQACQAEIKTLCSQEVSDSEDADGSGKIEECLKMKLQASKIQNETCKEEVAKLILEAKADIHVDPILYNACQLDLKVNCHDVPLGDGKQLQCILLALENKNIQFADCQKLLQTRVEMFNFASKVIPPQSLQEIVGQIASSKDKNYFIIIIIAGVGIFFIFGLFCGRATKRVHAEMKNK